MKICTMYLEFVQIYPLVTTTLSVRIPTVTLVYKLIQTQYPVALSIKIKACLPGGGDFTYLVTCLGEVTPLSI